MMRVSLHAALLLGAATGLAGGAASAQTLGGLPIREPGADHATGDTHSSAKASGLKQIVVDANGDGPYRTISAALDKIAPGGTIYVLHGDYQESLKLTKSVVIQGDRGPGDGVNIIAPKGEPCVAIDPKDAAATRVVIANVTLTAASLKPTGSACVHVAGGSFTLKESDVLGSNDAPAIEVSAGNIRLEKNAISGGQQGILLLQHRQQEDAYIMNNRISGNTVGIDIAKESIADVYITDNEIFENDKIGVNAIGGGSASLTGNSVRNNHGLGVYLEPRTRISYIRHNEIVGNHLDGISIPLGNNSIIEDNTIRGNDGMGVFCRVGYGPVPKIDNSNIIEGNKGDVRTKKSQVSCIGREPRR